MRRAPPHHRHAPRRQRRDQRAHLALRRVRAQEHDLRARLAHLALDAARRLRHGVEAARARRLLVAEHQKPVPPEVHRHEAPPQVRLHEPLRRHHHAPVRPHRAPAPVGRDRKPLRALNLGVEQVAHRDHLLLAAHPRHDAVAATPPSLHSPRVAPRSEGFRFPGIVVCGRCRGDARTCNPSARAAARASCSAPRRTTCACGGRRDGSSLGLSCRSSPSICSLLGAMGCRSRLCLRHPVHFCDMWLLCALTLRHHR